MLLHKWTPSIVPESFIFYNVHVWIKLGRIPMELWTDVRLAVVASVIGKPLTLDLATKERRRLSYARVCVELNVDSPMRADIIVNLRGEDFIVTINYEWKPQKCNLCRSFGHSSASYPKSVEHKEDVSNKDEDLTSVAYGDVVMESFKQLEEGEINSSLTMTIQEKVIENQNDFTLAARRKKELVSIRDKGKSVEMTMPNSFGSLMELREGDKWALSIVDGFPPPLQVDDKALVLKAIPFDGNPMGAIAPIHSHD